MLRARLDEAEGTLRAIRSGEVDALVVASDDGPRVYTLEGAEHSYRVLIESMSEGALILSADAMIIYANRRFGRMLRRPLTRLTGHSFRDLLSESDRKTLRSHMSRASKSAHTLQVLFHVTSGLQLPAQISIARLASNGSGGPAFSMVVTDLTDALTSERALRSLSRRLLQAQEDDRKRLADDLHDRATQGLSALLIRLQLLARNLPPRAKALQRELAEISDQVGKTAETVEGISRTLRPSVLNVLGLVPAARAAIGEFIARTGLHTTLTTPPGPLPLSSQSKLVLYRVLEETLSNVEMHAHATTVTVRLMQRPTFVALVVRDDGEGFNQAHRRAGGREKQGIGLIGLRERAAFVGGTLTVTSAPGAGTRVEARIPILRLSPHRQRGR
jgi:PAS domain S-box-containing protein